jgi:hypothetical protein
MSTYIFENAGQPTSQRFSSLENLAIHTPVQVLAWIEELGQASVEQIPELVAKQDS